MKRLLLAIFVSTLTASFSFAAAANETLLCEFPNSGYKIRLDGGKARLDKSNRFEIVNQSKKPKLDLKHDAHRGPVFKGTVSDRKIDIELPYTYTVALTDGGSVSAYGSVSIVSTGANGRVKIDFRVAWPEGGHSHGTPFRDGKGFCMIED